MALIQEGPDGGNDGLGKVHKPMPAIPETSAYNREKLESVLKKGGLSPDETKTLTTLLNGITADPITLQEFEGSQGGGLIKLTHPNDSKLLMALSQALTKAETSPELLQKACALAGLLMAAWADFPAHQKLAATCGKITAEDLITIAFAIHELRKPTLSAQTSRPTPPQKGPESGRHPTGKVNRAGPKSGVFSAADADEMTRVAEKLRGQAPDIQKKDDEEKTIDEVPITIRLVLEEIAGFQKEIQADESIESGSRQTLSFAIHYCLELMKRINARMLAAEPKEYQRLKGRANRALLPLREIKKIIEILQKKAHQDSRFRIIVITDGIIAQISALRAIAEGVRLGVKNGEDINEEMTNEQQINGMVSAFGLNHSYDKVVVHRLKQLFKTSKELFPNHTGNNLAAEELIGFMLETPLDKNSDAYQAWTTQTLVRSAGLLVPIDLEREDVKFFIHQGQLALDLKKTEYRNLRRDDAARLESLRVALETLDATSKRPENQDGTNRIDMRQANNFAGNIIGYMVLVPEAERSAPPFHASFEQLLGQLEATARGTATVMDASVTTNYMQQLESTVRTESDAAIDREFEKLTAAQREAKEAETKKLLKERKGAILGQEAKEVVGGLLDDVFGE